MNYSPFGHLNRVKLPVDFNDNPLIVKVTLKIINSRQHENLAFKKNRLETF